MAGKAAAALMMAAWGLAGCTVGPNFSAPAPVPAAPFWPASQTGAPAPSVVIPAPADPRWWDLFHDAELSALEQRLAAGNLDVRIYAERLGQSRAQLGPASADALPSLAANGSYTRERPSAKGVLSLFSAGGGSSFASQGSVASGLAGRQGAFPTSTAGRSGGIPPFNLFQYGFDASWELDLWGHARREIEAAGADLAAAQAEQRNVLVSAQAELARDYLQLRGLQTRAALANADLQADQHTLHLTEERARAGLTTALDVARQQAQLAGTEATLPPLATQQTQTLNALNLLLGQAPGNLDAELSAAAAVPPVPPVVPIGLPSELARRRPDIQAAEAQLHAATAEIGVAVADFYPKITLSGSIGIQALLAKNLGNWSARQYGFGPSISLPIFEGGRLRATLELRRAQQREAAIAYRRIVLQALGEISNALAAYTQDQLRLADLQQAQQANVTAVNLARQRYRQGIATFLDVLDAQRSEIQTEQQRADSTTTLGTDLVALYKALGGGWESDDRPQAKGDN